MKKVLGIIGLIAGVAICVQFNKREKRRSKINIRPEKTPDDFSTDNAVAISKRNDAGGVKATFEDVKASAVGNMYNRHQDASNIMKEAVDIICSRSEISADENRDLDQLSEELDKLLSEE